ncbi:MAG: hypothetical protein GXO74_16405 [Calditrichaeota bacterium]|nr:hypothetical protein [Calditrichota bacterium]
MKTNRVALSIRFFLILALFSSVLLAQQTTTGTTNQKTFFPNTQQSKQPQLKEPLKPNQLLYPLASFEEVALENIIDPDKYIVGPGDLFYINITGDKTFTFPTKVTPEGKLVVETIGIYPVAGKRLADVQQLIKKEGEKKYKLKKVFANLVQIRKLRIHVLGEVRYPGTYIAQAIDRVSYLLERAGLTDWADERHVEIRHADSRIDTLDFVRYKKEGFLDEDIFLQDGDVVYVPPTNANSPMVKIEGAISRPGTHPIKLKEKLSQFLLRTAGFNRSLDPTHIIVIRKQGNGQTQIFKVNLFADSTSKQISDLILQNGDEIKIPSIIKDVYVQGAVNIPGGYPYKDGLKAKDYVGMAGGMIEMGSMEKIKVIHFRDHSLDKGPNAPVELGDTIIVPQTFRKKFLEYLQIVTSISSVVLAYIATQRR